MSNLEFMSKFKPETRCIKELFDADMFVDTLEYFFTEVDKKC